MDELKGYQQVKNWLLTGITKKCIIRTVSMFEVGGKQVVRNKYPEETIKKILDASEELFLGKGYDNTTLQDIIDQLGGLTKGVIYYHFKSKKEIFDKVLERKYGNDVVIHFDNLKGVTGFQKIKELFLIIMRASEHQTLAYSARTLITNPKMVGERYKRAYDVSIPLMRGYINEGIADGSIVSEYPQEIAELIILSTNIWFAPLMYELSQEQLIHKLHFFKMLYEGVNFPLIDDEYMATCMAMHEMIQRNNH